MFELCQEEVQSKRDRELIYWKRLQINKENMNT